MAYQQQQQAPDEAPEYLVIGDTLNQIRDEMNGKFINLAQNMEYQLADLRRQIAAEKQIAADLRQQIKYSDAQRDEFKQEVSKKTMDLNQLNSFYKAATVNDESFNNLLNSIVQRHQQFQQALQQNNYNQNVGPMNKEWQDQIYKITQCIKASPDKSEFDAITDEMMNRTKELDIIQQIKGGKIPYSAMNDLVDQCEERHAAQSGDTMSTYKGPGKIENVEVLKNNQQWESLMNVLRDFMIKNYNMLSNRNDLYLQELSGRINDLQQFKNILNGKFDVEQKQNGGKKMKRKEIKALKVAEATQKTKNLTLNIQQRHNELQNKVKNTMNMNDNKDQMQLNNFSNNNNKVWRNEFSQDTKEVIDYLL